VGLKIKDISLAQHNIQLLLIRKPKGLLHPKYMSKIEFDDHLPAEIDAILQKDDLLVVFGLKKDIDKFVVI
jgi:hypothetical protein